MAVIERLWDEPEFEAEHRRRAVAEAVRWDSTMLSDQYQAFFLSLARMSGAITIRGRTAPKREFSFRTRRTLRAANQPAPSVMSRDNPVPSAVHLSLAVHHRPAHRASDAATPSPPASRSRLAWLSRGRDAYPVVRFSTISTVLTIMPDLRSSLPLFPETRRISGK